MGVLLLLLVMLTIITNVLPILHGFDPQIGVVFVMLDVLLE